MSAYCKEHAIPKNQCAECVVSAINKQTFVLKDVLAALDVMNNRLRKPPSLWKRFVEGFLENER